MATSVFYAIAADLIRYAAVTCDLPPAAATHDRYSEPYRDLSAQTGTVTTVANPTGQQYGFLSIPAQDILVSVPLAGAPIVKTTGALLLSMPDDAAHVPWRQDAPHKVDYWVFTDSGGHKCGEFEMDLFPSWSNLPPNTSV